MNNFEKRYIDNIFAKLYYRVCRKVKFFWQRRCRGWDDSETWSLDYTIARFILPRLRRFKEVNDGVPVNIGSLDEWNLIIDKIIFAFETYIKYDDYDVYIETNKKLAKQVDDGFDLFRKYFCQLWW
jgi:hypothetical protein